MLLSLGLDPLRRLPFEQVERSAQELLELQVFRQALSRVFIDHRQHANRSAIVGHRTHEVIALDVNRPLGS